MGDMHASPVQQSEIELSLSAQLEALLFVSGEPVAIAQLAAALDVAPSVIERGLRELDASLSTRGLRLQRHAGRVQLTTAGVGQRVARHLSANADVIQLGGRRAKTRFDVPQNFPVRQLREGHA